MNKNSYFKYKNDSLYKPYYNKNFRNNKFGERCNNCGKEGHFFQKCKKEINSFGIIGIIKHENQFKFLMIRRKDSFGYTDFVRGKYSQTNISQLQNKIDEMSIGEKKLLIEFLESEQDSKVFFEKMWKDKWGPPDGTIKQITDMYGIIHNNAMDDKQFKMEEDTSFKKFDTIKKGIYSNGEYITLLDILKKSTTTWSETEWEFPKGRRNVPEEPDIKCALREFEEETGISKSKLMIFNNVLPYEESFIGTNNKPYKYKYFLAYININDELENKKDIDSLFTNYQRNEVSALSFKTFEQCIQTIRPYCIERKNVINRIYNALTTYDIFIENCLAMVTCSNDNDIIINDDNININYNNDTNQNTIDNIIDNNTFNDDKIINTMVDKLINDDDTL